MERDKNEDLVEKKIEEESEVERRPRKPAEAVYGDTDMNPNADDQRDAHHADADEHL